MAHQQGPAADRAEAAQITAARQQLPSLWTAGQGAQAQAFQLRYNQGTPLRQQLHRSGGLQLEGADASIPAAQPCAAAWFGAAARLNQQITTAVAAQMGEEQRLAVQSLQPARLRFGQGRAADVALLQRQQP